jgi:hypothetical protein
VKAQLVEEGDHRRRIACDRQKEAKTISPALKSTSAIAGSWPVSRADENRAIDCIAALISKLRVRATTSGKCPGKICTSQIINRLHKCASGEIGLTMTQLRAIEILLRRIKSGELRHYSTRLSPVLRS